MVLIRPDGAPIEIVRQDAPIERIRQDGAHKFIVDFNSFEQDHLFEQLIATLFEAGYNPHVGDLVVNSLGQERPLLHRRGEDDEEAEHPPYIITPERLVRLIDLGTDAYEIPRYFSPFIYPLDYWKYAFEDFIVNLPVDYANLTERSVLSAVVRYKFIHKDFNELSRRDIEEMREGFMIFAAENRDIIDYINSLSDLEFIEYIQQFTELEKRFRFHLAQNEFYKEFESAYERAYGQAGEQIAEQVVEQGAIMRDLIGFYYTVEGVKTMDGKFLPLIFFVDEEYYFRVLKPFMEGYLVDDNQLEILDEYPQITKDKIISLNRKLFELLQNMCLSNLGIKYAFIDSKAYNPRFPADDFMPQGQLEIVDTFDQFLKLKEELDQ